MSSSSCSGITPAAAYMEFLMKDVKPRLFAETRTIDAAQTALSRYVLDIDILEKQGTFITTNPIKFTYKEMLCCLKTSDDSELFKLLRKEFKSTTHEVEKMKPSEAKTFKELKERFSKRYEQENNKAYVALIRKADDELRKENWVVRVQRLIFKALIGHYISLSQEKRISHISLTIEYVSLDDLDTIIAQKAEMDLKDQCNHCKAFFTSAHKLDKCVKCAKVFYCNEQCANNDLDKHRENCIAKD